MIFVTIGTQKQSFSRLFNLIEHSDLLKDENIIAQAGNTKFQSRIMKIYEFLSEEQMKEYINEAEFVICHGGVGSIFNALNMGKKVLAVPRLKKYEEHIDDHQLEICKELTSKNYIKMYDETRLFEDVIKASIESDLKKYEKNTEYLDILRKEI